MFRPAFIILAGVVTACGGGGGGSGSNSPIGASGAELEASFANLPEARRIASTGFADDTTDVSDAAGTTFSRQNSLFFIDETGSSLVVDIRNHDIEIRPTADPDVMVVSFNGRDYTLRSGDKFLGLDTFNGSADGGSQVLATSRVLRNTNLAAFAAGDGPDLDSSLVGDVGFVAWGFTTDPAEVAALAGSARYTGDAGGVIGTDKSYIAVGFGDAVLDANFNTGRISGSLDLAFDTEEGVIDSVIGINPADIRGNGFTSTLDVNMDDFGGGTVRATGIEGAFFGPDAKELGGTFFVTGEQNLGAGVEAGGLHGAYVATR